MERLQNYPEPKQDLARRADALPQAREAQLVVDGPSPTVAIANALRTQLETPFIHKWTILTCAIAGLLAAWAVIAFCPKSYHSTAKIMVRVGRESVALDPSATLGGQTLLIQKTREEELVSALDLLSSETVKNKVIERIGALPILDGALPDDDDASTQSVIGAKLEELVTQAKDTLFAFLVAAKIKSELSDHEASMMALDSSIDVYSPKDSSVITIIGKAETPRMAQAIAQKLAEAFVEEHVNLNRPHGSASFFQEECRELEEHLNEMVSQRADYMSKAKMVSVDSSKTILREQLTAIHKELLDARGRARRVDAEIENATAHLKTIPREFVNERKQRNNPTRTELQKKFFDLEIEEAKLRESRTAENPQLIRLQSELALLRKQIEQEATEKVDENYAANPTYLAVENSVKTLEMQRAGLKSYLQTKETQQQQLDQRIDKLLVQERELVTLNRDIAVAEASLNDLQVRAEQARVVDELSQKKISNVSIFQPASLKERAASPNKKIVTIMLPMLGIVAGLALAFSREICSTKLRHAEHLHTLVHPHVCYTVPLSRRVARNRNAEAQAVCRNILSSTSVEKLDSPVVGVIGATPGCGSSTIATELARESSQFVALKTNLVDADRRRMTVSKTFRHQKSLGLADLLTGSVEPEDCIHVVGERLAVTPVGGKRAATSVFKTMGQNGFIAELSAEGGMVVIDLPAASDSHEAAAFASCVDFVVLVVEAEKTTHAEAERLLQRLSQGNSRLIGLVLNKRRNHLPLLMRKVLFGSNT